MPHCWWSRLDPATAQQRAAARILGTAPAPFASTAWCGGGDGRKWRESWSRTRVSSARTLPHGLRASLNAFAMVERDRPEWGQRRRSTQRKIFDRARSALVPAVCIDASFPVQCVARGLFSLRHASQNTHRALAKRCMLLRNAGVAVIQSRVRHVDAVQSGWQRGTLEARGGVAVQVHGGVKDEPG